MAVYEDSGGNAVLKRESIATEKDVRVRVFFGHGGLMRQVAMPTDGQFVLTCGFDGSVCRRDLDGEKDTGSTPVCKGKYFSRVAVTANGQVAAAGDEQGSIRVFDPASSKSLRHWQRHGWDVREMAWVSDTQELISVSKKSVRGWKWESDVEAELDVELKGCIDAIGLAASADGKRLVMTKAAGELAAWIRDAPESLIILQGQFSSSPCVPSDGRFALVGMEDGSVAKIDLILGRKVAAFEGHSKRVKAMAVTPDGRFGISGSTDASVRLWALESGQCLAMMRGHEGSVESVAVSADGRRIASVAVDRTLRVWDIPDAILERAGTVRKDGYMNAKVVLVGDSGVGKSGLALRLWHDRWNATESTHGLEIQRLELPSLEINPDIKREVWLWDLAGQADYRLTHQLFMEQTALALLVFDPQDEKLYETMGYWQKALAKVAGKNGVRGILVAARCDRPGLRKTLKEVEEWAAQRGLHGPVITAAKLKKHAGVTELCELIEKLLPWDQMEFRSTMENFPPLKDAILAVRGNAEARGGVVVRPEGLEKRVREAVPTLDFTREDLRAVTGLLVGEGVLHALPYGDLVVLQPSYVNCYASILVKLAGEDEDHLGHVPLAMIQPGKLPEIEDEAQVIEDEDDEEAGSANEKKVTRKTQLKLPKRLSLEDERQLLPALETLFLKRSLAWKQETSKGAMLVFPSYVRLPRPNPPARPGRTVVYQFTGPLEEIYSTLVVQLHYSALFDNRKTRLYRQAVDFYTPTDKLAALTMREEGERGELEIYFGPGLNADLQASFQRFVDDHLHAKADDLARLRNYFCPKCHEEVTDRKAIDSALVRKRTKLVCHYCDPDDGPGEIVLHDVLEEQLTSAVGEVGADKARRRANAEIITASMEGIMVGEVQTTVFGADQIYRTQPQPDVGVDGEIEFRNKAKKATGLTYRVQLKSGISHLEVRKDGSEVFVMKEHYESHWARPGVVDVLLIIRNEVERTGQVLTRYMNATTAIRAAQKLNPGKKVAQIVFKGEDFTKEAVLRLRDERLKG